MVRIINNEARWSRVRSDISVFVSHKLRFNSSGIDTTLTWSATPNKGLVHLTEFNVRLPGNGSCDVDKCTNSRKRIICSATKNAMLRFERSTPLFHIYLCGHSIDDVRSNTAKGNIVFSRLTYSDVNGVLLRKGPRG